MAKKYDWKNIVDRIKVLIECEEEEGDSYDLKTESLGLFYRFLIMNNVVDNLSAISVTPSGEVYAQWENDDNIVSITFGLKEYIVVWKVDGKFNSKGAVESFAVEKIKNLNNMEA